MIQLRDIRRQYEAMKPELDEAMLAVAASGTHIMGPQVAELERSLAEYVGVKHCISCASGTDALTLALMALGIGAGDAVFLPDFTFFATAEAVALLGATPVFVDVREQDYNIDPADLVAKCRWMENRSDLRLAAVIAVDLFGMPADYSALRPVCRQYGMTLVEDGAQGFGGETNAGKACSFGDIATTSFFPAKPLGCYGDGGALFTNNDDWAALLRSLRVHGRGEDKYDNVRVGLNSRLDTLQAAILQVKLRHFDFELESVRETAKKYYELLNGKVTVPCIPDTVESSFAQYTIQSDDRDSIRGRLAAAGIQSMIYYPRPLSRQTAFAHLAGSQPACPMAERLAKRVLSLPMHPYITDEEIEKTVKQI